MVYTYDSKSYGRKAVRVRVPPSALFNDFNGFAIYQGVSDFFVTGI